MAKTVLTTKVVPGCEGCETRLVCPRHGERPEGERCIDCGVVGGHATTCIAPVPLMGDRSALAAYDAPYARREAEDAELDRLLSGGARLGAPGKAMQTLFDYCTGGACCGGRGCPACCPADAS